MKTRLQLAVALAASLVPILAHAAEPQIVALWANGAPGSEARRTEPELARDYWVKNIHNPSLTVFLPEPSRATGTAVVICPGGGHRELVFQAEGVEPALYLARLGVAAFALKYRLAREPGSTYTVERDEVADVQRAMRLVRSRAKEWGINPDRIGIMGWSAGGELAAYVSYGNGAGDPRAPDPVNRASAHPDFQIVIYPGPAGVPEHLPPTAPPAFFLAANDDPVPAATIATLMQEYRAAGIPAEIHLFAQGHHAFNMGNRSDLVTIRTWPQRLADWLNDSGLLKPAAPAGH